MRPPRHAIVAEITAKRLLAPRHLTRRDNRREGGDRAEPPGLRSATVSAPCPPIEWPVIALPLHVDREMVGDQRRQLLGDIGPHPVIGRPWLLGRIDVEAGALAEVPGAFSIVGHTRRRADWCRAR